MRLKNLRIRCINLGRSKDRWIKLSGAFSEYKVDRVEAIDGLQWSDGVYDEFGRPRWSTVPYDVNLDGYAGTCMYPTVYGCNQSHIKAMKEFLDSDEGWSIIVEDDTQPVADLSSIEVPDNSDWYYLIGQRHPGCRLSLFQDGSVRMARTLGAYALSRRAAELAIKSVQPAHYFSTDWQIPFRCFESMRRCRVQMPAWEELPYRIHAYGQRDSLVEHSDCSKISTFTKDGKKPWLEGYDRQPS